MQDNVFAIIIFVAAIAGIIALVVYKMKKDTNQQVTIDGFLDIYYQNLFGVIQDVVSLLSINVEGFDTKEDYERAIISVTIAKLEENCDEFGISSALFKLVDKEVLTNALYDILYTNKVQIFFSSLTEKIIKTKPELYDKEVIDAFENAQSAIDENDNNHDELQEEPTYEEKIVEPEKENTDAFNDEENKEIEVENVSTKNEEAVIHEDTTTFVEENNDVNISSENINDDVIDDIPNQTESSAENVVSDTYTNTVDDTIAHETLSSEEGICDYEINNTDNNE